MDTKKIITWLDAILDGDRESLTLGSVKIIEMIKKELKGAEAPGWTVINGEGDNVPQTYVLWRDYKGGIHWKSLDRDGNHWLQEMTHFRRIELPND